MVKFKSFEDFKERVLAALDAWDVKVLEIAELSSKYYNELEENKRLFQAMR